MKTLFIFLLSCLTCLSISCKKAVKESPLNNSQKNGERRSPEYLQLPPGGKFVNVKFNNGKSLGLYEVDSVYYIDGDVILTKNQLQILKAVNDNNARTHIATFSRHWGRGIIAYTIHSSLSTFTNTITAAMSDWTTAVPGLHFRPKNSFDNNWIEFTASTINASPIGMIGGKQIIQLDANPWVDLTSTTHEIGHALGLFHEQSRTDRDNFIVVNWANIRPPDEIRVNFQTWAETGFQGRNIGTFDFNSIMLYESFINDLNFVFNPNVPALTRIDGTTWGPNFLISPGDAETVRDLYGPPYAKISNELISSWQDGSGSFSDQFKFYVNLFSDEAGTVPFTATAAKDVHVKIVHYIWNNSQHQYIPTYTYNPAITVNTGQNSALIGTYLFWENSFMANPSEGEFYTFAIEDAFRRW